MQGQAPIDNIKGFGPLKGVLYYSMRLMPLYWVRRLIAALIAAWIKLTRPGGTDPQARATLADDDRRVVATLRRSGWTPLPPLLDNAQVAQVLEYLKQKELTAGDGTRFKSDAPPPNVSLASFPIATVLHCPHVMELMNRPQILAIARNYLGCTPTISGLRIDWSCPTAGGPGDVQQFHRDYDDWRFLKLFMYLTDVDDESGPHEFVAGSHVYSGRIRARPYAKEALQREYGADQLVRVHGKTGTCFMVDTWGIHKGNVPMHAPRMMLQIQYSLLPVLKFAYQPIDVELPPQFHRYANRLLVN